MKKLLSALLGVLLAFSAVVFVACTNDGDEPVKYTITFVDEDGTTVLGAVDVEEGQMPVFDGTPQKASTAEQTFTFAGWEPALAAATENATYKATYSASARMYNVSIGDAAPVQYAYGAKLVEPGDPVKDSTVSTVYTFDCWVDAEGNEWNFETDTVQGDVTLTAKFTETVRKYNVIIGDAATVQMDYGSKLVEPTDPSKDMTVSTVYTFDCWVGADGSEWDFENDTVQGDVTLTAKFTETVRKYNVIIGDEAAVQMDYGSKLTEPTEPTKPDTDTKTYTFDGWYNGDVKWNFETDTVQGDVTLTAKFIESTRYYSVNFVVDDEPYGTPLSVEYESSITAPEEPKKEAVDVVYTFEGWYNGDVKWNFASGKVTENLTLTAKFTTAPRMYNVTINGESEQYAYGSQLTEPQADVDDILCIATDGEGNVWDFENDTVQSDISLTYKWVLVNKNGSETMTVAEWTQADLDVIKNSNTTIVGAGFGLSSGHMESGIRLNGVQGNTDEIITFPKINYSKYDRVEYIITTTWGTKNMFIGETIEADHANKVGASWGNGGGEWTDYWVIRIENTEIRLCRSNGEVISTWNQSATAQLYPTISANIANGTEALVLTLSGGGQNIEISDPYCYVATDEDSIDVAEWTQENVTEIGEKNDNEGNVHLAPTNTLFDAAIRIGGTANQPVTVYFPKVNYNQYDSVEYKVTLNWGTRLITLGTSIDTAKDRIGSYQGNASATYEKYWIIRIEGTSIGLYDSTGTLISTWVDGAQVFPTISENIANGTEALVLTFNGAGMNIEISNAYVTVADYIAANTPNSFLS